jgi:hypothetical protein
VTGGHESYKWLLPVSFSGCKGLHTWLVQWLFHASIPDGYIDASMSDWYKGCNEASIPLLYSGYVFAYIALWYYGYIGASIPDWYNTYMYIKKYIYTHIYSRILHWDNGKIGVSINDWKMAFSARQYLMGIMAI